MRISINGTMREVAATTLAALLEELEYGGATVGTALNQDFIRANDRTTVSLTDGDAVEIVTPRQGG